MLKAQGNVVKLDLDGELPGYSFRLLDPKDPNNTGVIPPHVLWVPQEEDVAEMRPYLEATVPSSAEFRENFARQVWGAIETTGRNAPNVVSIPDALSALLIPEYQPIAIGFYDLDDCKGDLGGSMGELWPNGHPRGFNHDYTVPRVFKDSDRPLKQVYMNLVKDESRSGLGMIPADDISEIRNNFHSLRAARVLLIGMTSVHRGGEQFQLDFVARHFKRASDGLVICGGGYEVADKGMAAARVLDTLTEKGVGIAPDTPVFLIDDMEHNAARFRTVLERHVSRPRVQTFQHVFPHNPHHPRSNGGQHGHISDKAVYGGSGLHLGEDPNSIHGRTPLETVQLATEYLERMFGRTIHIPLSAILGRETKTA